MLKRLMLFFLLVWFLAPGVRAEYYTITSFNITVTFSEDGQADFEEVIDVQFSEPRHGLVRFIPYRSIVDNKQVDRIFSDIEVDGYKFSTSKENENIKIQIGDPNAFVEGRQVYRIRYHVLNPLNFFKDHSEFYWDLLGISSPVEIGQSSFRIIFPDKVNLTADDVYSYTGSSGSKTSTVSMQVNPHEFTGTSTQKFLPGEALTVAVRLVGDTFKPLSSWAYFVKVHGLLFAPIFFLLSGLIALFMARNKRQPIMTEYFPPEGISPAIAGGFVDNSVDSSDVLCLIPHLANHGYLRIESEEGGFLKKSNIIFYKLKDAGAELYSFESEFFNALFATGDLVELKHLRDKFYTHMASVRASVKSWIMAQGWYDEEQKKMGCVTGLLGLAALGWGGYAIFARQNMDGIALIIVGFVLFFFTGRFNKRTPLGNETFQKLEGFRQFVKKAERPVIERLMKEDPLYYDKTMPYALAFGYLKQWNKQFDGLLSQPPSWYSSPVMYGTNLNQSWTSFSEHFPSEINNIGSVFSSSPSSSGSGGGGGGGFSGGGSGGGGTGSW